MIFSGTVRIHHLPNITHSWIPVPNSSATNMTQNAPYNGTVTVNTELLLIISGSAMDDSPANTKGALLVLASSLLKLQYWPVSEAGGKNLEFSTRREVTQQTESLRHKVINRALN